MDSLTSLMQSIDIISKSIPEGEYLKMCNDMKDIYKVIPRPTSPEASLPRVNVPRRPLLLPDTDSDSEDDDDQFLMRPLQNHLDELLQISNELGYTRREIRQRQSRLKQLKIRQRITAAVRKDAIKERSQQLGFRMRQFTIEELREKGYTVPNERSFYKSYLDRQNLITQEIVTDLRDDLNELLLHEQELTTRRANLQIVVHGRPL